MKLGLLIACGMGLSFLCGMALESARTAAGSLAAEPRVTGIGGIFFKAKDPVKLREWYRTHLGIEAQGGDQGGPQFKTFEWREKEHPEKTGVTVWAVFPEGSRYFDPSHAPFMINYRVANLDRLLGQLRQEGVTVDEKTDVEENGRFGWALDPEGNRMELWEPMESHPK
ncbi:MAG: VOC family protein [Candidatus Acidiferrales bacterium]